MSATASQVKGLVFGMLAVIKKDLHRRKDSGEVRSEPDTLVRLERTDDQMDLAEAGLLFLSDSTVMEWAKKEIEPFAVRIRGNDATLFSEVDTLLDSAEGDGKASARVVSIVAGVWNLLSDSAKNSLLTRIGIVEKLVRERP